MKRIYWELLLGLVFVCLGTALAYNYLSGIESFWSAQKIWNIILLALWGVVAFGYWHQGWKIHVAKSATHVSMVLPAAVFVVQCILFVKGIYYQDLSLTIGAVLVNSAVSFNLYQLIRFKR